MPARRIVQNILWVAGFILIFFCLLTARFHYQSKRFYQEGQAALQKEQNQLAEGMFDRSIRAHSLFDHYGRQSAKALRKMAEEEERNGHLIRAEQLYQTLLSALSAIDTGLSSQRGEQLERLEEKVADLRERAVHQASAEIRSPEISNAKQ